MTGPRPNEPTDGRILPFRPRNAGGVQRSPPPPPVEGLSKYERSGGDPDDYRHRMTMNILAASVIIILILGGIWIADTMARMRKNQDCVLIGRSGCTPVTIPPATR